MATTVIISVNRYFPEGKEKGKNGKAKRLVVDVRKMELRGDFLFNDRAICTLVKRNGERYISVKIRKKPNRPWWDKSPIREEEYKWEKDGNLSLDRFPGWLANTIKEKDEDFSAAKRRADALVSEMLTAPPENIAA